MAVARSVRERRSLTQCSTDMNPRRQWLNEQHPATDYRLRTTGYGLPATDYRPRITGHGDRLGGRLRILGNGPGAREQDAQARDTGIHGNGADLMLSNDKMQRTSPAKMKARR